MQQLSAQRQPVGRAVYDRLGFWDTYASVKEDDARDILKSGLPPSTWIAFPTDGAGVGHIHLVAPQAVSATVVFDHARTSAVLDEVTPNRTGAGYGTQTALNVMNLFGACGFEELHVHATLDAGAYAWGHMGGLPYDPNDCGIWSWVDPRYQAIRADLPAQVRYKMDDVVADRSPTSLWRLVDARHDVAPTLKSVFERANSGSQDDQVRREQILVCRKEPAHLVRDSFSDRAIPMGRYLLENASWKGSFDLTNSNGAMDRARQYVREHQQQAANHRHASVG